MSKAVQTVSEAKSEELANAYQFFNERAETLSNSYHLLKGKVAQLTRELDVVSAQKDEELEKKKQLERTHHEKHRGCRKFEMAVISC